MITFKFNLHKSILESKYTGEVTEKEILDYISSMKNSRSFPRVLKILTDATDASVNISKASLSLIKDETSQIVDQYDIVIDAMVIANPRETALSLIYQESIKTKNYQFKVFSTREAAGEWLSSF